MLRTCKVCTQEKPYDPAAKRESPAMGFIGYTCYACHRLKCNLRREGLDVTDPDALAQQAERKAFRKRQKGIMQVSKPYGIMLAEAQSALDAWHAQNPEQVSPEHLAKAVAYAQHKLNLFGSDAFDYRKAR